MLAENPQTDARVDSRDAWVTTFAALLICSVALGAPYLVSVALRPIAADLGGLRAVPSLAGSLALLGTGVGGLLMGWVAERTGVRSTAIFGALMVCAGLALSAQGEVWQLYVGHGLLIGLLGNGAINAPIYVYVTRWFERRRGTALALIASGQYVAGAFWPPLFERSLAAYGWQNTMMGFGILIALIVVPLAALFLRPPPPDPKPAGAATGGAAGARSVLGLPPVVTFSLLAGAAFLCCVPMAMPASHLIALCTDIGLSPSRGAMMLSLLLTCAFVSRQFWGWMSDRIGGMKTLVIGSAAQAAATAGFIVTQDEAGLFAVATAFGLGFAGLIPAYILTARQLFPASEASWRVPTILLTGMSGMAFGSWVAGILYDHFGFYAPAFTTGLAFNLVNLAILSWLLWRWMRTQRTVTLA
jgi:MFS family permease